MAGALAGVTEADFARVAEAVSGKRWRFSPQAPDWVGYPIAKALCIDIVENKGGKARVVGMVAGWIANGRLVVVELLDEHRKTKKYVELGAEDIIPF